MKTASTRGRWLAAALIAASLAGCGQGGGPREQAPPEVVVAKAFLGSVPDTHEYVGTVRALNEIDVRARVRGYLVERRFTEGQRVEKDGVLFRIDPRSYQVALDEAKGRLASAEASLALADREYARAQELSQKNVVSPSVLDQRREERDGALADVQTEKAAVAAAALDLSWCEVKAPIAGRIGLALVDIGNLVGESGQDTVLAHIVQVDPIYVFFAPTELERLAAARAARTAGAPEPLSVEIRLGDGTAYPERGTVDYVDPTVDPTRGTVTVRAVVPNPDGVLRPGQFVRTIAVFPDIRDAVLVPERAVLEEQGGSYVLVVKPDDEVEYRNVQAGAAHGGLRRIVKGLAVGERVIADGVQKARPGQKVVAKEEGSSPASDAAAAPSSP
jgi:membrane fusion protein (multidrug efflux system)